MAIPTTTTNFISQQNEQVITEAYERIGIVGDLLTPQQIDSAQRSLNFILSSWINKGLNLWTIKTEEKLLDSSGSRSAYELSNTVSKLLEVNLRNVQISQDNTPIIRDVPLSQLSRNEYMAIPNKQMTGIPTSYYFNRQINPILTLWPIPKWEENPTKTLFIDYSINFTAVHMMADIGTMLNLAPIPVRFFDALTAELAYRLGIKKPIDPNILGVLKQEAEIAHKLASAEDTSEVPLRISTNWSN